MDVCFCLILILFVAGRQKGDIVGTTKGEQFVKVVCVC